MNKKQIFIDASSLKLLTCWRSFYNTVIMGYKSIEDGRWDYKMHYGSAIHKFLEAYYLGTPYYDCTKIAVDFWMPQAEKILTPDHYNSVNLVKICRAYAREYPRKTTEEGYFLPRLPDDFQPYKDTNNRDTVEYKFAIPIWNNENFDLVLTGTIDLYCKYRAYDHVVVDHKSTGWYSDVSTENYFDQYCMDIQPMLYSKVAKEALKLQEYPPVVINGIFIKKPTQKAEKEGEFDGVVLKRSEPIAYSNEQMANFIVWYDRAIEVITEYLKDNRPVRLYDAYNLAACKQAYGLCKYFNVCKLPKQFHEAALKARFTTKTYNPLEFR